MGVDPLLRLDLGCGRVTAQGFLGVDISPEVAPDYCVDLTGPWPFIDASVQEARCSHFLEHLQPTQRIHFANELDRVLVDNGTATFVTPLGFNRMMQDPSHAWPPIVKGSYYYWSRAWRERNGLDHYETLHGLRCDLLLIDAHILCNAEQYSQLGDYERGLRIMADPDAQTDLVAVVRKEPRR